MPLSRPTQDGLKARGFPKARGFASYVPLQSEK
jgi:hypothetical protein